MSEPLSQRLVFRRKGCDSYISSKAGNSLFVLLRHSALTTMHETVLSLENFPPALVAAIDFTD